MYRKFTADWVFPVSSDPIRNGVVICKEDGTVEALLSPEEAQSEGVLDGSMEVMEGVLCPGFVNAHCHLELSHMKGVIPPGTGLPSFIRKVITSRDAAAEVMQAAMEAADAEMHAEGIVAVGDISNLDVTFPVKQKSRLYYHTFVELLGIDPARAYQVVDHGKALLERLRALGLAGSLSPHAPYTASPQLLKAISTCAYEEDMILTLHNQECDAEHEMFISGTGDMMDVLKEVGIDMTVFRPTGFSSLASTLTHLSPCNSLQLVHNTCSKEEDVDKAGEFGFQLWWCLCPRANIYIENRLPDVEMLRRKGLRMTVGTDGLTSNHSLSMLEELKVIQQAFPSTPLQELLQWATLNGARFLGQSQHLGSLEKGKRPGLNLISQMNVQNLEFSEGSRIASVTFSGDPLK